MKMEAGRTSSARKTLNTIFHALFVATLIVSAGLILRDTGTVPSHPMDQHFVETVNLHISRNEGQWTFQYPNLQNTGGITSSLIVGLYKLVVPTSKETLNWHIRILAMGLYLGSAYLLIQSLITRPSLRILGLILVGVSGFQFIQPSSELFAGGLFTLFLVSVHQRWPLMVSALLLAMFSVCKVEMTVASAAITLFWWQWERMRGTGRAWRALVYPIGLACLLLAPAFLLEGANPLTGGRSFLAFSSAYTEMFLAHQFTGIKEAPLDRMMNIAMSTNFPGAQSLIDVIKRFPRLYFDYVGVSATWSLPNLVHALKLLLIPFALVIVNHRRLAHLRPLLYILLLCMMLTLVPAWLTIYMRQRYVIKFLPAVVCISIAGASQLSRYQSRIMPILWTCAIATMIWEVVFFSDMWKYSHFK